MIGLEQWSVRRGGTTAYLELFFTFSSLLRFLVFKSLRWVALYMCADETFAAYEKTAKLMKVARMGEKLTRQEFARLLKLLGASEGRDASSVVHKFSVKAGCVGRGGRLPCTVATRAPRGVFPLNGIAPANTYINTRRKLEFYMR